jgi:hypothetical protein
MYALDTQVEYDSGRKPRLNNDTQEPNRRDECESLIGENTNHSCQIEFTIHWR